MKVLSGISLIFLLFSYHTALTQKIKAKQPGALQAKVQDYTYPYYAIINNGPSPISGCFLSYKNVSYFVTTRHNFYTTTNERRKITNVMIFMDPVNMKNNAKVLSLNMTEQKLLPVCFDFGCTDIVLLPVNIPRDQQVNYVTIEPKESFEGKEMMVVGYIKDSLNIIKTRFSGFLDRDSTFFLTEKSSPKEQEGSPVLISSKIKGVTKVVLAGIYSGKEISQEDFNKGLITRAYFITKFLNSKSKTELLGKD